MSYIIFEEQYFEVFPAKHMERTPFYNQILVDFDDTIFDGAGSDAETFNNRTELKAKPGAARYMQQLILDGWELYIYTCRPHWQYKYIQDELKRNGIHYSHIICGTKPRADIYLDNKALHFTSWEKAYKDIGLRKRQAIGLQQPFTTYEKQLQKIKIKYLPKTDKHILDIGCGDGSVFEGTDYRLHGFDIDTRAVELCRQVKNYELCTTDAGELLNIDKYEIVTLLGVLEHVDQPTALLNEFCRARQLYITVPNAGSFHRLVGKEAGLISNLVQLTDQDRAIGHKHYFSYPKFEDMIMRYAGQNDFHIAEVGTVGFKIASNQQMENFSEISLHLHTAAEIAGIAGPNQSYGAEIFAHLIKR